MKRAVPDTNIHISAIILAGLPAAFHELAFAGVFTLVTSPTLLDELDDVLIQRFRKSPAEADLIRRKLEAISEMVSTIDHLHVIKDDPDDDRVLECAVAGKADCVVTGDDHLLDLGSYEGIPIINFRQFMDTLNSTN